MFKLTINKDNDGYVVVRLMDGREVVSMLASKNTVHRSDVVSILNDLIIELDAVDYIVD